MCLVSRENGDFYTKSEAREVFDVTGAGDTVLAIMSLGIVAGWTWKISVNLANIAAGIVVGKVGAATISGDELMRNYSPVEP
jgi:bifunctional ADP-heptose synthase (sugar kinase/adenylyltransferase)